MSGKILLRCSFLCSWFFLGCKNQEKIIFMDFSNNFKQFFCRLFSDNRTTSNDFSCSQSLLHILLYFPALLSHAPFCLSHAPFCMSLNLKQFQLSHVWYLNDTCWMKFEQCIFSSCIWNKVWIELSLSLSLSQPS